MREETCLVSERRKQKWFYHIQKGEVEEVKKMIGAGYDVNTLNQKNQNALHRMKQISNSKKKQALEIAYLLLENGIEINKKDEEDKTPLNDYALTMHFPEVSRLLVEKGAHVFYKPQHADNVLTYALCFGLKELTDILIHEKGMDINQKNKNKTTFAEIAKDSPLKYVILKALKRYEDLLDDKQRKMVEKEQLRLLFH